MKKPADYESEQNSGDSVVGRLRNRANAWSEGGASGLLAAGPDWLKPTVETAVDGTLATVAGVRGVFGPTSRWLAPWFVIVGGQRCGTTSMYRYLTAHPQVLAALTKEVHFFDVNYGRGPDWYAGHFATRRRAGWRSRRRGTPTFTGEASPYYMFHPHAMRRLYEMLPDTKIILMLRDPVQRAVSHYAHERSKGLETAELAEALRLEESRLAGEEEKMIADETYTSFAHQHYSYLRRGDYLAQLQRVYDCYSKEQVFLVNSNDFYRDPDARYNELLSFLELDEHRLPTYKRYNTYAPTKPAADTRAELVRHFAPRNAALYDYLGQDLGWSR